MCEGGGNGSHYHVICEHVTPPSSPASPHVVPPSSSASPHMTPPQPHPSPVSPHVTPPSSPASPGLLTEALLNMVKIGPAYPTHGGLFIEFPTMDVACKVCAALQESQVKVTLLPSIYVSLGRHRWAFIGITPTLYCSQTSWMLNKRLCWCSLMRGVVVTRGGACCQGSGVISTHIRCSILLKADLCQGMCVCVQVCVHGVYVWVGVQLKEQLFTVLKLLPLLLTKLYFILVQVLNFRNEPTHQVGVM